MCILSRMQTILNTISCERSFTDLTLSYSTILPHSNCTSRSLGSKPNHHRILGVPLHPQEWSRFCGPRFCFFIWSCPSSHPHYHMCLCRTLYQKKGSFSGEIYSVCGVKLQLNEARGYTTTFRIMKAQKAWPIYKMCRFGWEMNLADTMYSKL